jgi:TPP-dependent 2-oxoacid decarboxylase
MWVSNKDSSIYSISVLFKFYEHDQENKSWCCRYEFQMQYGSIGWSVGATLGYAQSVPNKRVIACIGDGSFQVSIAPIYFSSSNLKKTELLYAINVNFLLYTKILNFCFKLMY